MVAKILKTNIREADDPLNSSEQKPHLCHALTNQSSNLPDTTLTTSRCDKQLERKTIGITTLKISCLGHNAKC